MRRAEIHRVLFEQETTAGRTIDIAVQVLIWSSLLAACLETMPQVGDGLRSFLVLFERVVIVLFSIEYVARLTLSPRPFRYATSFFGVIDLLAILPFYLALGLDLRSVRVFRVFRTLRAFRLLRYSRAAGRLAEAFNSIKDELVVYLGATLFLFLLASLGIYSFEHEAQPEAYGSVLDAMWWTIVTLTTVGYGDVYPVTAGGKVFTSIVLILGLGVVAVPTGLIASALSGLDDSK